MTSFQHSSTSNNTPWRGSFNRTVALAPLTRTVSGIPVVASWPALNLATRNFSRRRSGIANLVTTYHRFRTAGEVAGITGSPALFCIPAQQTIPMLVRWMLVLEDSDEDRLYFGKGLPHAWVASGKQIRIEQAPTRWGRVNFKMQTDLAKKAVAATVELAHAGAPKELQVKFRLPRQNAVRSVTVNERAVALGGPHNDTAIFPTEGERSFEMISRLR